MNNQETNFAYKISNALNENLDTLPIAVTKRLETARKLAITRRKPNASLVTAAQARFAASTGDFFDRPFSWLGKLGLAMPAFVLVIGLAGLFQFEQQQHIKETADIDALVLSDELPISAYLDHGFSAYLATRDE